MARTARWTKEQRSKLLQLVNSGVPEQEIRQQLATKDVKGKSRDMNSVEFANQLKQAMVEAGVIKQASTKTKDAKEVLYAVTNTGRLTISDFAEATGAAAGELFTLERPRGRSQAWRLVPFKE